MQARNVAFNLLKLLVLPKLGSCREYLEDSCGPQDRCVRQEIRPGGRGAGEKQARRLSTG